jgi:predicted membrane channel-forming protein YqfA (hemolysin III family)
MALRRTAIFVIVVTLAFIVGTVITSFDLSTPRSEQWQSVRMYLVFAAYLLMLLAVRHYLKQEVQPRSSKRWLRILKLTVASISVGGVAYVLGVVLSLFLGGADSVGPMMIPLLSAVPAVAIAVLPLLSKYMS